MVLRSGDSPPPSLAPFQIRVLKDRSGTDPAQVPASANIVFYRQGATVVGGPFTIPYTIIGDPDPPPPIEITVYHVGDTKVQDDLQVEVDSSLLLKVYGLVVVATSLSRILVQNHSVQPSITVSPGQRLLNRTTQPMVYNDAAGNTGTGSSLLATDPATGLASAYIRAYRFDYVISGADLAARIVPDQVGSYVMRA